MIWLHKLPRKTKPRITKKHFGFISMLLNIFFMLLNVNMTVFWGLYLFVVLFTFQMRLKPNEQRRAFEIDAYNIWRGQRN